MRMCQIQIKGPKKQYKGFRPTQGDKVSIQVRENSTPIMPHSVQGCSGLPQGTTDPPKVLRMLPQTITVSKSISEEGTPTRKKDRFPSESPDSFPKFHTGKLRPNSGTQTQIQHSLTSLGVYKYTRKEPKHTSVRLKHASGDPDIHHGPYNQQESADNCHYTQTRLRYPRQHYQGFTLS